MLPGPIHRLNPPETSAAASILPPPSDRPTGRLLPLNAWGYTLTPVTGNADRFLAAGLYG